MVREIGVDPACYDLGRHFLTDRQTGDTMRSNEQIAEDLKSLSEAIQTAVEDWFFANPLQPEPSE